MPLTDAEESALIDALRAAARAHILPRFRRPEMQQVTAKSTDDDLVTLADQEAEAAVAAAATRLLPGAEVIGEEASEADPTLPARIPGAARAVIIDPVDGTWNFAAGLATFGMILAVTERGQTVFGLLYDPVMDDWVLTRRGGGTWFCRPGAAPLRLQASGPAPEAMGALGSIKLFPDARRARLAADLAGLPGRSGSLRCACHEYRLVCMGKAGMMLAARPKPWDHAAGVLAVTEAGGAAGWLDGTDYRPGAVREGTLLVTRLAGDFDAAQARFGWLDTKEART